MVVDNKTKTFDKISFKEGTVILVDKPIDWTSFDVVNKIRFALKSVEGKLKVGHAGTLDPKATGLLLICTGKFTKKITEYQDLKKRYTGTFFLGASRPSFDTETEINKTFPIEHLTDDSIKQATKQFIGNIAQIPPIYSAIRKKGVRLYELARQGIEVTPEPRNVFIDSFEITDINLPIVSFDVKCNKGTYIRSLANDFGEELKSGAYLESLVRNKIGDYDVADAINPETFSELVSKRQANEGI